MFFRALTMFRFPQAMDFSELEATRVSQCLGEHIAFELDAQMTVRKLRFLDAAIDALDIGQSDGSVGNLSAKFALMAGEFGQLFDLLQSTFSLHSVEGDQ